MELRIALTRSAQRFVTREGLSVRDTPVTMALQYTTAPIALAAALPPGGWESAATTDHRARLEQRADVVLRPPVTGLSMTTGRHDGNQPDTLPNLLRSARRTSTPGTRR